MAKRDTFLCLVLMGLMSMTAWAHERVQEDSRWELAKQQYKDGQYESAAGLFRQLRAEFPDSQEAAYQLGRCERRLENYWEAATLFGEAYEADPQSYWAEPALYYRALACRDGNCTEIARESIDTLFQHYPDSSWTARAAILEAELYGDSTDSAETALTVELEAGSAFDGVMNSPVRARGAENIQLEQVQSVIDNYPNTATALRARNTLAHLQIRQGHKDEAIETLEGLLTQLGDSAPQSRIVEKSRERLAGLYHAQGRKAEALGVYDSLAESARDRKVVANAKLQGAGLDFELLQKRRWANEEIAAEEWDRVRERCQKVLADESAGDGLKARAELMVLESYLWERKPKECQSAAENYILRYSFEQYSWEYAMARLFLGESLAAQGKLKESLDTFQWLESEVIANPELFKQKATLARLYYRLYDLHSRLENTEQAESYADIVLLDYSDTSYEWLVRKSKWKCE